jgi:MtrB/PioB family decaheme-associated outer membrane protein
MTKLARRDKGRPTLLVLALAAAYGSAQAQAQTQAPAPAQEAAPAQEIVREGSVSVGGYGLTGDSNDRAQFGQYNGLRFVGPAAGILDFSYYRLDPKQGTSLSFTGANLALQTRELAAVWKNQGDWKLGASFNQQVHWDPYSANTGMIGFGTTTPQVVALPGGVGTGAEADFKVSRSAVGLSVWKALAPSLALEVNLKTEDREGARVFGNGFTCPSSVAPGCRGATTANTGSAVLMLPEAIDSNQTQVDARVSYSDGALNLSAGYYGSFYNNSNGVLSPSVPGSLYNPVGTLLPLNTGLQGILSNPLALPPDNNAQFFDVTGNYALAPTTQAKFKLSYSWAEQNQDFQSVGLSGAPAGVGNLDGKVSTTLALIGITSRPMPKLSLAADLRYSDSDDKTPLALYTVQGPVTTPPDPLTLYSTNMQMPLRTTRARVEAAYQFTPEYRGTFDVAYEAIDRGVFTSTSSVSGVSALRQKTDETTVRAELRRTLAENMSGALSVSGAWRDGSDWLQPNSGNGVTTVSDAYTAFGPSSVFPTTLADRQRSKVKLTINWQPVEALQLQFLAEGGRDNYTNPSQYPQQGVGGSDLNMFAIDWAYVIAEQWNLTGYLSQGRQTIDQSRYAGYVMSYTGTNSAVGLGLTGKPMEQLQVGANVSYLFDRNGYAQALEANAPPESVALLSVSGGLPDTSFRQTSVTLFGKYDIDKQSAVRVNLVYLRSTVNDWAYLYGNTPYAYADATTLYQQPDQSVGMIGVAYIYKF